MRIAHGVAEEEDERGIGGSYGRERKEGGSLRRPANFELAWLIVTGQARGDFLFLGLCRLDPILLLFPSLAFAMKR